ncbi:MAG: cytochrome c biogenesis protein CcsA [Bacteroidaceae bacterium]|nr:cytochrome c biogenesis protein CcsA [Bacteroidaceae bacterium]
MKGGGILDRTVLVLVAAVIVMMIAATVVERNEGSLVAFELFYHSFAFVLLWAAATAGAAFLLIHRKVWKRPAVAAMHLAFLLMLSGALTTHLWSEEGAVHLREGETIKVPVEMTLVGFDISYYPGTDTPMDYTSTVTVNGKTAFISMNRILKTGGYRFYQMSYDEDGDGTLLSFSHDPWGVGLSYAGYFLLFVSLILYFFDRGSAFRRILRSLAPCLALLSLSPLHAQAGQPRAFPREVADRLGNLEVFYNGRVTSVQTMADGYVRKVYGKSKVAGFSSVQVLTGWMYYYDSWQDVPLKLKGNEAFYLMDEAASGRPLRILPFPGEGGVLKWYSPAGELPGMPLSDEWAFLQQVVPMLGDEVSMERFDEAVALLDKVHEYQVGRAGDALPDAAHKRAEKLYNAIGLPRVPAMISLAAGILLFLVSAVSPVSVRRRGYGRCVTAASLLLLLYLSIIIVLRWFVSGNMPVSNGSELMTFIAWMAMALTSGLSGRLSVLKPMGFILAGFGMLVASLGISNPQITPLMPVLSSPLLAIHVSCMMISYTLFGLSALNSLVALLAKEDGDRTAISRLMLFPATFLLVAGTFIGAIWANISWGNYWGWDPKETWALITCLVYSFALHRTGLPFLENNRGFNLFCLFAFISVLITYFGVNFLLGGMHSYSQ